MRRITCSASDAIIWLMVESWSVRSRAARAVHVRRPGRHRRHQVGALDGGRGQQVAGLVDEGALVPHVPVGDVADEHLPPVGVVARVDECRGAKGSLPRGVGYCIRGMSP